MFVRSLELMGFKSFPEKTRLEFRPGVTAVVGPNGSGKSNISDAVRWVLGEQSAKSLRGGKMEDVIFTGTQHRRSLGFAQVTLSLDNSDHTMPLDFSEISVTRKTYRSGEGEYFINGAVCRLKDIHELFMDTGVGREGYSIIGQGKIDEILSARSEDRRLLFEEAAGIVKYKSRRQEAFGKLQKEKQNLLRVDDIITEVETQIQPLYVQSEQAKQYLDLKADLKTVQVGLFVTQTQTMQEQARALDESAISLERQIQTEEATLQRIKAESESFHTQTETAETGLREAAEREKKLRVQANQAQSRAQVAEETIFHLNANLERLRKELEQKEVILREKQAERDQQDEKIINVETALEDKMQSLSDYQVNINVIGAEFSKKEKELECDQTELIRLIETLSRLKAEKRGRQEQAEQIEIDKQETDQAYALTESQLEMCRQDETKATTELLRIDNLLHSLRGLSKELQTERERLNTAESAQNNKQVKASNQLLESESRLRVLRELASDYEGYQSSVKTILKGKRDDPKRFGGVCGAVGELAQIAKEYEIALEIALGGAAQDIVTQTDNDALAIIAYLKAHNEGRATFLPLNVVRGRGSGSQEKNLSDEKGFLGVAKDLIQYEKQYENIFDHLLGSVYVFDDAVNAARFAQKFKRRFKLVTLEGELFHPSGSITGGSARMRTANGTGIFSRSREIRDLEAAGDSLRRLKQTLESELAALRAKREQIILEEENTRAQTPGLLAEKNEWEIKIRQAQTRRQAIDEKKHELQKALEHLRGQANMARDEIQMRQETAAQTESQVMLLHKRIDDNKDALSDEKAAREKRVKTRTDLQIEIESSKQNLNVFRENRRRAQSDIERVLSEKAATARELLTCEQSVRDKEELIMQTRAEINETQAALNELTPQIEQIESSIAQLRVKMDQSRNVIQKQMQVVSGLTNDLTRLEMKKEQAEAENRRLYEEMWDEYKITEQTAKDLKPPEQSAALLQKDERRLKHEIQELGPVNVSAIEEYKHMKERLDFLQTQRRDIVHAELDLQKIFDELTRLMEKQFSEQFRLISQNFSQVFQEIFEGGRAGLTMADGVNVLEAGIDIVAQPPGKNLQTLSLLSGGERAMTAIALLFGILRMKPSPFCILDEIEAALDDANVLRFAHYVRNIAAQTQFILITHRKGTMESADALYGVTMQEQGISKLVSVKLTEE